MSSSFPTVIVGATGAIGSAIARRLVAQKRPVHLISRDSDLLQSNRTSTSTTACLLASVAAVTHCPVRWSVVRCVELAQELNGAKFSVADVMKDGELEKAVKHAAEQVSPHSLTSSHTACLHRLLLPPVG